MSDSRQDRDERRPSLLLAQNNERLDGIWPVVTGDVATEGVRRLVADDLSLVHVRTGRHADEVVDPATTSHGSDLARPT
jgi:hypothetical protein